MDKATSDLVNCFFEAVKRAARDGETVRFVTHVQLEDLSKIVPVYIVVSGDESHKEPELPAYLRGNAG